MAKLSPPDLSNKLLQLKRREKAGFDWLYDTYSAALYGVVLKIVKEEAMANDVMQDAFLKAWQKIDTYDDQKGTLFTWLLNIFRNTAIDKWRSKRNKATIQTESQAVYNTGSDDSMEKQTDLIGLKETIDTLKPAYKEVIDLVYLQGYTQQEVAEHLNTPLGTVKTRARAALQQLRKLLKP